MLFLKNTRIKYAKKCLNLYYKKKKHTHTSLNMPKKKKIIHPFSPLKNYARHYKNYSYKGKTWLFKQISNKFTMTHSI